MKTLCIYGCGGMGREVADLAYDMKNWDKVIFLDDNVRKRMIDEVEVYTLDEAMSKFDASSMNFIVATGEPSSRQVLYEKLERMKLNTISIIDPCFKLSRFSSIASGTIFHSGATITVNVHIGKGCLINKHVVIGHDVNVGDYTVISPNASVGGDVDIGAKCYIGSGAIIRNGITIGANSIIGMGSVVLKNVEPNTVVVGNPAAFLRMNDEGKVFRNNR